MADLTDATPLHLRLVPAFIESVRLVLHTMIGIKVSILEPYLAKDPGDQHDVSGVIGFSGALGGSAVLALPMATAEKLVAKFAGSEFLSDSPEFADAIGELINMIAGAAKSKLGELAGISTPSVVIGASHKVPPLRGVPCLVMPCQCEFGAFAIKLNLRKQSVAA